MSILVGTAHKAVAKPAKSAQPSPIILSLVSLVSSSEIVPSPSVVSFCYMAIRTTMLKQNSILMISTGIIASLSQKNATIEIQNGLVCQKTMTSARGARGAAMFKSKKLIYPATQRMTRVHFFWLGNSLTGL